MRKRLLSAVAVLTAILAMGIPSTATGASADVIGSFVLRARHSNMCLEVAGASTANGALLQQAACVPGARHQLWLMNRPCGPNCYVNWINLNSGKCLDLQSAPSRINGTTVVQWDCDDANRTTQRWQVLKIGTLVNKDLYHIRNLCCPVLYLNVSGASQAVGAPATALTFHGIGFHAEFTLA
jgi:pectinesterase